MHALKNNLLVKLALLIIAAFCLVSMVTFVIRYNSLKQQRDMLAADIAALEERIDAVQAALDTPFDDEYVIKIAREKLNLRLPEEVVFYNDLTD